MNFGTGNKKLSSSLTFKLKIVAIIRIFKPFSEKY